MAIQVERIRSDIAALAALTASPGGGADRPTFSAAWRAARDYVERQLAGCGGRTRVDAAGNLHARAADLPWDAPAWLSGSHLDSVPHGGDFDGVAGVVGALEVLRSAADERRRGLPLELVVFAEEEGTTFGLGMLGSRAWIGELTAERLAALRNADGEDYLAAGTAHGVRPAALAEERLRPEAIIGFVEIHIEQGPGMWMRGERVAVVTAIAGRRQYRCTLTGLANHAGSTSMRDRRDALAGAGEIIAHVEALAGELSPQAVATVGRIECRPNAINVIPEHVEFTIDLRAPDDGVLSAGHAALESIVDQAAQRRGLRYELALTEQQPAVALDPRVCERLRAAGAALGMAAVPSAVSGALHDAAILAPLVPTAMLFVASRDGNSHNPAVFSRVEDIAAAACILEDAVRRGGLEGA